MSYYLFDNPRIGIILAVIIEIILIILWLTIRQKMRWWYLLIGPCLAALFILGDVLVETPREQVIRHTRAIVQYAEDENHQAIIDSLSADFLHNQAVDKAAATKVIRRYLNRPTIQNNNITDLIVRDVNNRTGDVEFAATTVLDPQSPFAGALPFVRTRWLFTYIRDPDGVFRVRDITMLNFGEGPGFDIIGGVSFPRNVF